MKPLIFILSVGLFLAACGTETKKEPEPVRQPGLSPELKERLADYRSTDHLRDSLIQALETLPEPERAKLYLKKTTSREEIRRWLLTGAYQSMRKMDVEGKTATGRRTIWFPDLPSGSGDSLMTYPVGTRLLVANREPVSGAVTDYEVMVRQPAGWDFFVFSRSMDEQTTSAHYSYPTDCITCHLGPVQQDPMFRFTMHLNQKHPITRSSVSYDGFVSARLMPALEENRKQDGVFGPYLKLSLKVNEPGKRAEDIR